MKKMVVMATGDIGKRIREARERLPGKVRIIDLANALGVTHGRVSNWERGENDPDSSLHVKIAKELNVSVDWLLTGHKSPDKNTISGPFFPVSFDPIAIPYGGLVPASNWSDPTDTDDFIEVDPTLAGPGRFCARIEGASMMPMLQPDDLVVFQSYNDRRRRLGHVVLARRPDGAVTIKEMSYEGSRFILNSINPEFENPTADSWEAAAFLVGIVRTKGTKRLTIYDPEGLTVEK